MKVGRGTEDDVKVGPLIDATQRGKVAELVQDATGKGARCWSAAASARAPATSTSRPCSAACRGGRPAAQGGDLRPGRAGHRLRRRGRGDRRRQRHRVRPRRLRLHARHQARLPRGREARDRHGRPQPGHGLQRRGAVRRRQGLGLRPRGRPEGIDEYLEIKYVAMAIVVRTRLQRVRDWFEEAAASGLIEAERMALATATPDGRPSVRIVLLKGIDDDGISFFTNYGSRKGRELDANPRAAATLYWQPLYRAVRLEGPVERLTPEESDAYFATRARAAPRSAPGPRRRAASCGSRRARRARAGGRAALPRRGPAPRLLGRLPAPAPTRSSSGRAAPTACTTASTSCCSRRRRLAVRAPVALTHRVFRLRQPTCGEGAGMRATREYGGWGSAACSR